MWHSFRHLCVHQNQLGWCTTNLLQKLDSCTNPFFIFNISFLPTIKGKKCSEAWLQSFHNENNDSFTKMAKKKGRGILRSGNIREPLIWTLTMPFRTHVRQHQKKKKCIQSTNLEFLYFFKKVIPVPLFVKTILHGREWKWEGILQKSQPFSSLYNTI